MKQKDQIINQLINLWNANKQDIYQDHMAYNFHRTKQITQIQQSQTNKQRKQALLSQHTRVQF
ncbi:hypothetical protein TTHERM_000361739 (macronuclear) [Tetrahymena thermophila SB210]|uniref:Uncharacterized protein n=1 Tax=Tetrahymena thermophila (strain SB210) TaxID=312017 RepID=W7XAY1_TETTS|nr:hypothetical protein TTHERM_000361739 [Tetrahymena thermophila SB210]EWS76540.1 hypothetical protein TTHERM_000361739 [Tetrahymena thermophila SB210]|eukprot:XP_012650912.1 hypothetical protein TTHERM_000361739 [Tetrahymena thermophila SB210]